MVGDLCVAPPGRALPPPADAKEGLTRITGTWLLCSQRGILGESDAAGLRIETTGEVLLLRWDNGTLAGEPSGANVTVLESYPVQANFTVAGGGYIPTNPVTTEGPRHLATWLMSGAVADYVDATTNPDTTPKPEPVCAAGAPTQDDVRRACALPDGPHLPLSTLDEFASAIAGAWYRCAGPVLGSDDDGILLSKDSYYAIQFSKGAPIARSDLWHSGTVGLLDTTSMNGPGFYEVDLHGAVGTRGFDPQLTDAPRVFHAQVITSVPKSIKYVSLPCNP